MIALAALLAFAAVVLGGGAASAWLGAAAERRAAIARRLAAIAGSAAAVEAPLLKGDRRSAAALLDARFGWLLPLRALARMIRQAGLQERAGPLLLALPALFATGALVIASFGAPLAAVLAAGVAAAALPLVLLRRRCVPRRSTSSARPCRRATGS
jgi:hypothetical protein